MGSLKITKSSSITQLPFLLPHSGGSAPRPAEPSLCVRDILQGQIFCDWKMTLYCTAFEIALAFFFFIFFYFWLCFNYVWILISERVVLEIK